MKKILLILGVLLAVSVLAGGISIAYAKGNDDGNGNAVQMQERPRYCEQVLLGTIMQKTGNAAAGILTLLPRGGNTTVNITVNSNTYYRPWLRPKQEVTFSDLGYGDWVAVCVNNNNMAKLVVLLQVPERPFYLRLEGNVTAVNGNVITGSIKGGGTFTINLTGVSGNFSGAAGQYIELNIGKNVPPAWGLFNRFTMRNLGAEVSLWMRSHGWMMGRED